MCVMGVGCTINSSMTPDNFINVSYLTCGLLVGETVPSIQYWHHDPVPQKPTDSLRNFDRLLMWILISITPIYIPKWWALLQPLFIHVDFQSVQMMPDASLYKLNVETHPGFTHRDSYWCTVSLHVESESSSTLCKCFMARSCVFPVFGWLHCNHERVGWPVITLGFSQVKQCGWGIFKDKRAMLSFTQQSMFSVNGILLSVPPRTTATAENVTREFRNDDIKVWTNHTHFALLVTWKLFLTPLIYIIAQELKRQKAEYDLGWENLN